MNVTLAKSAGFCFGVKRAVKTVYEETDKSDKPIYTFGPIIHNEDVVADLEKKGVAVVNSVEELRDKPKGTVIIRSHGVEKEVYEQIKMLGFEIVDATCPFVLKIHRIVQQYAKDGYHIIIVGNPVHPEVQGIVGWCPDSTYSVVRDAEEMDKLVFPKDQKLCIVSQTTFNYNKFKELVEIISKKGYDIIVLNTICNATEERQTEACELAKNSDAMIVVGDKNSSNTQKLFEICKKECVNTYYIQTSADMDYSKLKTFNSVAITAAASTPNNIIEEVSKNVRNEL